MELYSVCEKQIGETRLEKCIALWRLQCKQKSSKTLQDKLVTDVRVRKKCQGMNENCQCVRKCLI